jgi:NifU-like protein involved in Fe-S cluster formation
MCPVIYAYLTLMSATLYNHDILRLATSLVPDDHLKNPIGNAEKRSPLCGSRIYAEVAVDDGGMITDIALRASACAMGQASAAILRENARGHHLHDVVIIRAGIANALADKGIMPDIWQQLELLTPARDYKARHAAILLPYDALIAALEAVPGKAG